MPKVEIEQFSAARDSYTYLVVSANRMSPFLDSQC